MLRFPPKRILVPIDLSQASLAAWLHARSLADKFGASFEAVHVLDLLPSAVSSAQRARLGSKLRRELLAAIRSRIGDAARVHILEGDPVVTILRLARTRRPDLIVMGTHGRRGFTRVLMGSVAEAVVRRSPVPVLTVRRGPRRIRSLLAPVNFTHYSDFGFAFAAEAACALRARLTVLHVAPDPRLGPDRRIGPNPRFLLGNMVRRLPQEVVGSCRPELVVREGIPALEILKAVRGHELVVLVAHRKSPLEDLVLGTTAERVLRHSSIPVLAIPSPLPGASGPRRNWAGSLMTAGAK